MKRQSNTSGDSPRIPPLTRWARWLGTSVLLIALDLVVSMFLAAFVWLLLAAVGAVRLFGAEPTMDDFGYPRAIEGGGLEVQVQFNGPIAFEYDARAGTPAWTMELLTPKSITGGAKRKNTFHADLRVPEAWRTTNGDYLHEMLAKGHMGASADFGRQADQDCTWSLTNVFPQDQDLNSNFWSHAIEDRGIRKHVRDEGLAAVIVTGVFYAQAKNGRVSIRTMGEHDVWVPESAGKAVVFLRTADDWKSWQCAFSAAWIVPNRPTPHDAPDTKYRVSVREFEKQLRRDLFWKLDDETEDRLETALGQAEKD